MLKLGVKKYELIMVNDGEIQIRLLEARNKYAVLGISAPKEISIDREVIFYRKQENNLFLMSSF